MNTLLVANRGEIALRILRTARAMGLRTVAVHSSADADSPHVAAADVAVEIGPAEAAQSYLDGARIIEAARATGAGLIHPGYGFLAENAEFAAACAAAGLVFIGPPPAAIAAMGDKAQARARMQAAGVPCVPGWQGDDQADEALLGAARKLGFPLMLKAAAGGGGKGMRRVARAADLPAALARARAEAQAAFGSDAMILERLVEGARHVEVQVLADAHGGCVHLFERDCSAQRRHQKILEEAPAPGITPALRAEMGQAAVRAAQAVGYVGAGTVEFLLAPDGQFFFLEMNTRLQVEHPVTEMITGLDLVALQIDIARGAALPFAQDDIAISGHAIEVRLYAEDPARGFLPQTGRIAAWQPPHRDGVRVDAGIAEGQRITPHYDPMLAKIIAHGPDRATALARLRAALGHTVLAGLIHNRDFLIALLDDPAVIAGQITTDHLDRHHPEGFAQPLTPADRVAALAAWAEAEAARCASQAVIPHGALAGWSSTGALATPLSLSVNGEPVEGRLTIGRDGRRLQADGHGWQLAGEGAGLRADGARLGVVASVRSDAGLTVVTERRTLQLAARSFGAANGAAADGLVTAPMPGLLRELFAREGAQVAAGDRLAVLEAMKMQHVLTAPIAGRVTAVLASPGAQLAQGAPVIEIAPAEAPA